MQRPRRARGARLPGARRRGRHRRSRCWPRRRGSGAPTGSAYAGSSCWRSALPTRSTRCWPRPASTREPSSAGRVALPLGRRPARRRPAPASSARSSTPDPVVRDEEASTRWSSPPGTRSRAHERRSPRRHARAGDVAGGGQGDLRAHRPDDAAGAHRHAGAGRTPDDRSASWGRAVPSRLRDLSRYLAAVTTRAERLDQQVAPRPPLMTSSRPAGRLLHAVAALPDGQPLPQHLRDARWLIEEYRVSLFAQQLGNPGEGQRPAHPQGAGPLRVLVWTGDRPPAPPPDDPGDAFFDEIVGGADPAQLREAGDLAATVLVRGARQSHDPRLVERVVHLAETEGLETLAEVWSGAPADTLAGSLWRLFLLRSWVHADPERVSPASTRRASGGSTWRGWSRASPTRPPGRAEADGRRGAARHRERRLRRHAVPRAAFARIVAAGRAALGQSSHEDITGCWCCPSSSSRRSRGNRRHARLSDYDDASAPGRGSPGSQNQPLRAATRREALPVRRTSTPPAA